MLLSGRLVNIFISHFCVMFVTYNVGILILWSLPLSLLVTDVGFRIQYNRDPGDATVSAHT